MSAQTRQTIFVYGTLRQHGSNAFRMDGAIFIANATTNGRLYRVDSYPGAIFDPNAETRMVGELYQVTDNHLRILDEFEGDEYRRVNIMVTTDKGTAEAWAWEYQRPIEPLTLMATGDWLKEYDP